MSTFGPDAAPLESPTVLAGDADPGDPPLVSLIVRSMARSTLPEALDSIARQTYPNVETVVVNALGLDHPPPGTGCGPFLLRFVDRGRALDRSAAANAGLDAARGRYIGFLDDDDLLFPDHVAVLAEILRRQANARVAYSGVRMIAYRPDGTPDFEILLNQPFHSPSLRAQNYIPIHAVLFDRILLEAGCRFDESLTLYEDWDFWLQLASHSEFLHVDHITACYRNFGHSGFGLQADPAKVAAGRAALFDKWRKIWSGAELSEALAALRDGIIHRQPHNHAAEFPALEPLATRLAEQSALLQHVLERLDTDRQAREDLRDRQRRIDELSETVLNLRDQIGERSRQLEQIQRSTSWRVTRPLRGLARTLRRLRGSGPR
ncbi:MAG: glycosyltransferase [Candidatus Contendobacter sp.]